MKNKEYKVYEINKKSGKFGVVFVICGLLLAISICNVLGYLFFSNGINIVSGREASTGNFYAVEVDSFDKYDEAYAFAQELQKKGGAGYITYNKKYKVLTSLYLTNSDAKKVAENLERDYPNARVYELVLEDVDMPSDLDEKQSKALGSSLAVAKSNISSMTNIYLGLDKGDISEQTAKTTLYTLSTDLESERTSIKTAFHSKDTAIYLKYGMYYDDLISNIKQIEKIDLLGSEFSQMVKYQQIKLAFLYISMCNLFD